MSDENDSSIFCIGHQKESMTFLPELQQTADAQHLIGDMPGRKDTRGTDVVWSINYNLNQVVEACGSLKPVFLLEYFEAFKGRELGMKPLLEFITSLASDSEDALRIAASIIVVGSK